MSWNLAGYLLSQLLCLPVLELSWRLIGPGKLYGWIYTIFTTLVFAAIARLTWESLLRAKYKLRVVAIASLLAMVFARAAFLGLGREFYWFDAIVLLEGFLLVLAGVLMGMSSPYMKQPDICLGLSIMWLIQALLAFGFILHYPKWVAIDEYSRALVGIAGFLFIGCRLRHRLHRSRCQGPMADRRFLS